MKLCQQSTMTTENKSACGSSPLGTAVYITLRLLMGATFDFPKLLFANLSNLPIPINHPSVLGILIFIQCVYACACLFSSSYSSGSFLFSVSRGIAMSRPNVTHWHYIVIWHSNWGISIRTKTKSCHLGKRNNLDHLTPSDQEWPRQNFSLQY